MSIEIQDQFIIIEQPDLFMELPLGENYSVRSLLSIIKAHSY